MKQLVPSEHPASFRQMKQESKCDRTQNNAYSRKTSSHKSQGRSNRSTKGRVSSRKLTVSTLLPATNNVPLNITGTPQPLLPALTSSKLKHSIPELSMGTAARAHRESESAKKGCTAKSPSITPDLQASKLSKSLQPGRGLLPLSQEFPRVRLCHRLAGLLRRLVRRS